MKRITAHGTRKVIFNVVMPGTGQPAVLNIVCGDKTHSPYLWIGAPNGGPCLGTLDRKEMRNLARVILQEVG